MKNQYFADKRDYFKYCFLLDLMNSGQGFRQLLFIPLLTPDDGKGDGQLTRYEEGEYGGHSDMWSFLQDCLMRNDRRLVNLRPYMRNKGFTYYPYKDDEFFTHETRETYFSGVPGRFLKSSLVFFDPDNGFEVPSMTFGTGDKYLRYSELASVMTKMDSGSLAVVYQHLPRRSRDLLFREIGRKVKDSTAAKKVFFVSDNVVAFVLVPKKGISVNALHSVLSKYSDAHGLLFVVD